MAHKPTLYIGIGGSGCKTVSLIKHNFRETYGYGKIPENVRFFCIDTDGCTDPTLDGDFYVIAPDDSAPNGGPDYLPGLRDWYILNDFNACGTGASRADARHALETSHKNILSRIRVIISELLDVALNSGSTEIDVRFAMSLAGGTGSGIFIPLAMLVSQFKAVNLYGYGILHGIFRKCDPGGPVYQRAFANSYASVLELDYLQHASEDNHIKMSVAGIDCILRAPLFKGFYLVEHLNNAGKIIQNVEDLYNVLASSMFSSSFENTGETAACNVEGIYDIKNKKGWLGGTGACEIIFNGDKFADLYSHKVAHNIIQNTLQENTNNGIRLLNSFISNSHLPLFDATELSHSLRNHIGIGSPPMFKLSSTRSTSYIRQEVLRFLLPIHKDNSIDGQFVENMTVLRYFLLSNGKNPYTGLQFLDALIEHCQNMREAIIEEIIDIKKRVDSEKNLLNIDIQVHSSPFSRHRTEFITCVEKNTQRIAELQHELLLREYGIDFMNVLADRAEKYKKKVAEYSQALHDAEGYLSDCIEDLERRLSSSSSQFVFDVTAMYWKEFEKDNCPDYYTANLLGWYLEEEEGQLSMSNRLLQDINAQPFIDHYRNIPLESIIGSMSESQYKAMLRFIRTSAIRMLMLDGRGHMINDMLATDCMTRNITISMYGKKKIATMEADLEGIWTVWDNCQTNIVWNAITDESFRQKALIAVHEGNIIPYCVDAFYPDIIQKEYTELIEEGRYNPHIDAILCERMQMSSHSLKPMQAVITPEAKETETNSNKDIRKQQSQEEGNRIIHVFIAGSKELKNERDLIRVELSKLANAFNLDIRPHSFEDFKASLKGQHGGRQADYNKFIRDVADVVIFIFDSKAGSITEEEFDVAYDSLAESKRPDIFVYGRNMSSEDLTLKKIKEKIFCYGQEYYVEYTGQEDLRYQFYRDMVSYLL